MQIEMAAEFFSSDNIRAFNDIDPFNNNQISGFLCLQQGPQYGSLFIAYVNETEIPQAIPCTPKIHYPFNKQNKYTFPPATKVEIYEKIDGTNIFGYKYHDSKNKEFVSYKTRLLPFLGNRRFGPFLDYWKSILLKYPISEYILQHGNMSFELYGALNKHLIEYDNSLEAALLFGRNSRGEILTPSLIPIDMPKASLLKVIDKNYIESYKQLQLDLEKKLEKTNNGFKGLEGTVWYLFSQTGEVIQFKCKPLTIETIHWTSGELNKNVIEATCWNVFETEDEITYQSAVNLLLEEFTEQKIKDYEKIIAETIEKVKQEAETIKKVKELYGKFGKSILSNKIEIMRYLSSYFPKTLMGRVYSIAMSIEDKK